MKHCVDGVARLMLKCFSFFIGVAGFKKNSNGYIEEAGNLHVSMRFYRHVSAFFVSRCEQARNWNMSLLTCTRLDVVSSLCIVFLKPCLRTVLLLLVFTTCLNLWWLSVMKF